jgi:HK97 family phage portal protein
VNPIARAFRALSAWGASWWFGNPGAGLACNPSMPIDTYEGAAALSLPAVARGVAVYSDAVASLPRRVVRRVPGGGLEVDDASDAAHLLDAVAYFDLEGITASAVLCGNGYAAISRNDRGGVADLAWIASERVQPGLDDRGRLFYRISADMALGERERIAPAADIVHLKFRASGSRSRYLGVSPLATCAPALAMAMRARDFQSEIFRNVTTPSVYLTAAGKIADDQVSRLRTEWNQNYGTGNRGRTAILSGGLEPKVLDLSTAVDAQLDKQFEYSVAEVARVLGVPISLLMQPASVPHALAIEETRAFAALSLAPFCERFEDELGSKLLTPAQRAQGFEIEFDLSALLISPGEIADRMSKMVNGGIMTTNESRNQLGLPDVDGGDELRVPVNTQRLSLWITAAPQAQPTANPETPDAGSELMDAASAATPLRRIA